MMANANAPHAGPTQNPFPAWYLLEGTINAADDAIERASSSCEGWEWGCAVVVVLSVAAEFILASVHPSYDSPWNRWGSAIADALIALGIVGEVLFGRIDGRYQTELRKRSNSKLAEALDRATKAEEDLAKLKAPRMLTAEQQAELESVLRTPDRLNVNIVKCGDEPEIGRLFAQITTIFMRSGWTVSLQIAPAGASVEGIFVLAPSGPMHADRAAREMVDALNNAGIAARRGPLIGPYPQGSSREPSQTDASPQIRVDVGHKPL